MDRFIDLDAWNVLDLAAVERLRLDGAPSTYCNAWFSLGTDAVSLTIQARPGAGDQYEAQVADIEEQWRGIVARWKAARAAVAVR